MEAYLFTHCWMTGVVSYIGKTPSYLAKAATKTS